MGCRRPVATTAWPPSGAPTGRFGSFAITRSGRARRPASRPFPGNPDYAYDTNVIGGCTTLDVDPKSRELYGSWLSLNGTTFNWRRRSDAVGHLDHV